MLNIYPWHVGETFKHFPLSCWTNGKRACRLEYHLVFGSSSYILFAPCGWYNIFSKDPLLLKSNLKHIEEWCIANRLIWNYTKTFQVVFKAPNKQISNPEHFKLKLGNHELETKVCTKFLGIELDSQILFREHVSEVCRKLNFVLLLMRCIRPYLDHDTMINILHLFLPSPYLWHWVLWSCC